MRAFPQQNQLPVRRNGTGASKVQHRFNHSSPPASSSSPQPTKTATSNTQEQLHSQKIKICIVGVGGAGCNTVSNMMKFHQQELAEQTTKSPIEFIAINTDAQCLERTVCTHRVQIGVQTTNGLGAGAHPEVGKKSAEENLEKVLEKISDARIIFLCSGMGGGTGTGASPIIAMEARKRGILTIGVVFTPFEFEGPQRAKVAEEGLRQLEQVRGNTLLNVWPTFCRQ